MEQLAQQLLNGATLGATYAVVALGFGLVFSVLRVINIAHPEFFMLGAFAAVVISRLTDGLPLPAPLTMLAMLISGLAVAIAAGLIVERAVIRPLRGSYLLIPFIATAGVSIVIQNTVERFFGPDPVVIRTVLPTDSLRVAGLFVTPSQLMVVLSSLAVMTVISLYVRRTRLGLATRAVAERWNMAAACGVDVNRVFQVTMALAAATAGIAGVSVGLLHRQALPTMGVIFGTKSFVCMLVAGNRNIEAIAVVGIGLGVLEALVAGYISSNYRDAIAFATLLVVLFFRPSGLFGSYPADD